MDKTHAKQMSNVWMNNLVFTKLKLIFWEAYPDESLFGEFAKHTVDGLQIRRSPPAMYKTRPK